MLWLGYIIHPDCMCFPVLWESHEIEQSRLTIKCVSPPYSIESGTRIILVQSLSLTIYNAKSMQISGKAIIIYCLAFSPISSAFQPLQGAGLNRSFGLPHQNRVL